MALCVATAAAVALACAGARSQQRRHPLVGTPLALVAPDLEGREVDLAAMQGKVRVVDFWATWCEPCKEAMPGLDQAARELGPSGLEVFGLSVDEDRSLVLDYLRERPVTFTILWDQGARRLSRLGMSFMPVTLIVDRRGIIRHVHQGWRDGQGRQERQEMEALLAEP